MMVVSTCWVVLPVLLGLGVVVVECVPVGDAVEPAVPDDWPWASVVEDVVAPFGAEATVLPTTKLLVVTLGVSAVVDGVGEAVALGERVVEVAAEGEGLADVADGLAAVPRGTV